MGPFLRLLVASSMLLLVVLEDFNPLGYLSFPPPPFKTGRPNVRFCYIIYISNSSQLSKYQYFVNLEQLLS
jgi:hypothetical protein